MMLKGVTPNRSTTPGQTSYTKVMGNTIRLDVFTVEQVTKKGGYGVGGGAWRSRCRDVNMIKPYCMKSSKN